MNENPILPLLPAPLQKPFWRSSRFWMAFAVLFLFAWQWRATQNALTSARLELARYQATHEKAEQGDRALLAKAVEQTAELQRRYGALEGRLEEFQTQAEALRSLYQEAALSRDDALLAEVEQNIMIALQQLQFTGNVQAAILALEAADERLARQERPQFLPLRRSLARDLERLRTTPFVDIPGMNLRLENVVTSTDRLPLLLAFSSQKSPPKPEVPPEAASWWKKLLADSWQEISGAVRIRRFDGKEPVLLSPEQEVILRANIKLRLLNARLALFSRDQWLFRNELQAAQEWLQRYFDTEDAHVKKAQDALAELAAAKIIVTYPNLNDSLGALQALKAGRERH
jgi:uroporphyrin-3 C-methyltransferase